MQNLLKVKLDYEGELRMIPGTDFKREKGWLKIYDGEKLVEAFPEEHVEVWFGWVGQPPRSDAS